MTNVVDDFTLVMYDYVSWVKVKPEVRGVIYYQLIFEMGDHCVDHPFRVDNRESIIHRKWRGHNAQSKKAAGWHSEL